MTKLVALEGKKQPKNTVKLGKYDFKYPEIGTVRVSLKPHTMYDAVIHWHVDLPNNDGNPYFNGSAFCLYEVSVKRRFWHRLYLSKEAYIVRQIKYTKKQLIKHLDEKRAIAELNEKLL